MNFGTKKKIEGIENKLLLTDIDNVSFTSYTELNEEPGYDVLFDINNNSS